MKNWRPELASLLEENFGKKSLLKVVQEFSTRTRIPLLQATTYEKHWYRKKAYPEIYNRYAERSKVNKKWRKQIFARDSNSCQACGETKTLELAHVTPVAKMWKADKETGVRNSFAEDNLVTLCHACHVSYDKRKTADKRSEKVAKLFEKIIKKRGWKHKKRN